MADPALREAFTDLHGDRLHGFAILVTLGDRDLAGRLSAAVLDEGASRVEQLRHPERAAAWLRARVVVEARGRAWGSRRPPLAERREAMADLGVDPVTFDALASLDVNGRAAVLASGVEALSDADVEEIAGGDERVRRARREYAAAYVAAMQSRGAAPTAGALSNRIRELAAPLVSRSE